MKKITRFLACNNKSTLTLLGVALILSAVLWLAGWSGGTVDPITKTIDRFLKADLALRGGNYSLVLGSSSAEQLNTQALSCGAWVNRAVGGSVLSDTLNYLSRQSLSVSPTTVFVYGGENDVAWAGVDTAINSYQQLLSELNSQFPNARLIVSQIKYSPVRQNHWGDFQRINAVLANIAKVRPNVYFLALDEPQREENPNGLYQNDGLHLTSAGYSSMIKGINQLCQ